MFNYSKLKGRIIEKIGSFSEYANMLGMSYQSLNMKLNGNRKFSQDQILKSANILDIDIQDIGIYFFNLNVEKITTSQEC